MTGDPGTPSSVEGVAIIGMAGRFPGSRNTQEFWNNLKAGVESISFFSDEELAASGVDVTSVKENPNYVRARGVLPDADLFDATFFGVSPREAELLDPQHRLLLECSWEALESAGYDPESYNGSIGVYAGMNKSSYLFSNLYPNGHTISAFGPNQTELANERDYLTTRISYKLNLKGPSVSVQTACSTSLVAIVLAYQSLLIYQCDMALAGGVCVRVPQNQGYWYEETGIASPDGHCRPFDEQAQGTVGGSGVGVVVLKRLADAITDGDSIYAVIKGAAINNDGAAKLSYTAPNVDGQAEVIAMAQAAAGVDPGTVSYIECHGTGTPLGDPIEIAGLTQAFRAGTDARAFCAIGSVKSNIGHLDAAAGVAGLIKTSLALHHKLLPPSLHYERPNPKCHFEATPFYVNAKLTEWKPGDTPRRAGVSSFGFGGTNAHAVLEEAPPVQPSGQSRSRQLLRLSAKTNSALEAVTANLAKYLKDNPECNLADVAYTLSVGRRGFDHRRILVCQDLDHAVTALETLDRAQVTTLNQERRNAPVVFMFPGQGSQYLSMGRELYHSELVFRGELDRCAELLEPHLGCKLLQVMFPGEGRAEEATERLTQTAMAQPAIFAIEYSLAKLWMEWGIRPEAMIGHSVGEFVAACLAGVFSLKDAVTLVAARGRFIQTLPAGAMLAVPLSENEVSQFLGKELALAAVNGLSSCVVSGPREAVAGLERQLAKRETAGRHLHTSHAFHSAMMDPILPKFEEEVRKVSLHPPSIPFISSVTGNWITPEEATRPSYWVNHLRKTVRYSEGLSVLLEEPHRVFLEVGPGQTLSTFAKRHPALGVEHTVLPTLRHAQEETSDVESMLNSLGRLWLAGVEVDWSKFYAGERRHRIPLPTYPFERKRFWIDPPLTGKQHACVSKPSEESLNREVAVNKAEDPPPGRSEGVMRAPQLKLVPHPATSRKARILETLVNITHDLSGIEVAALDVNATFLELGFDSLFLTQANTEFRKKFNIKITFRQLLNEAPTLDSLAQFIDSNLRPEAFLEESSQPALVPAPPLVGLSPQKIGLESSSASGQMVAQQMARLNEASPQQWASVSTHTLERIIHEQLQVMSKQLALLRNGDTSASVLPSPQTAPSRQSVQVGQAVKEGVAPLGRRMEADAASVQDGPESDESNSQRFGPWKPIDRSSLEGLPPWQQKHLDELIARYTARTQKSKELTQAHRSHFADPRTVSGFRTAWKEMVYPIVAVRSSGSKLWDVDGNEYIDMTMGFGSNLFGHSPAFVTRALEEQIRKDMAIGPQSTLAGEVAQSICDLTGIERVSFCNTGSEAVLAAIRVARTTTGRNKIALFSGAYHGIFDEVLVKSSPSASKLRPIPVAPGIPQHMVQDVLLLEYGNAESMKVLQEHIEELAAVLVEPVQSRHPELQPREFLHLLREWTERSGVVLIFDEMITGFRLHPGGAQAWFDVRADLVTYGKVIGGGMPIGVVGGKAALMDALDGGMWNYGDDSFPEVGVTYFAGTFVRHPLALAASLSVLHYLRDSGPELQQRLNERATRFATNLNRHFQSTGAPIHIQNCGSMLHWECIEDQKFAGLFFFHLREKGIHVWEGRPFFISTAHSDDDLAVVTRAIEESVAEMQAVGYFGGGSAANKATEPAPSSVRAVVTLPLTDAQREIWLAVQMGDEASRAFVDCLALDLRGPLRIAALLQALDEVVARHDSLRTTFSDSGDEQHVASQALLDVPVEDVSHLTHTQAHERVAATATAISREPFSLSQGPLLRARIVKLQEQHHVLVLATHHIVVDGWSLGVLVSELGTIYSAVCKGARHDLSVPKQFVDYLRWQAIQLRNGEQATNESYWLDLFKDIPPILDLPADRPRPANKTYSAEVEEIILPASLSQDLRSVAARRGSSLFGFLLTAFYVLVHRLTGNDDLVLGIPTAGQLAFEAPDLVGHCVNFLPLRSHIDSNPPFSEYLVAVKHLILAAQEHQNYTYGGLLQQLQLPRDPSRLPLLSISFNLEKAGARQEFAALDVAVSVQPKGAINFDSQINVTEEGKDLKVKWHYNTDLFDSGTIRRWLRHYQTLLQGIATKLEERVANLPILTDAEKQQLLFEWNDTKKAYPNDRCIHELFEEQVDRSPEAVAVIFDGKELTYRELNRQANQLAHYLQKLGIGPDVLVGICVDRGTEMIVGLLGILKAGGAYVPLDRTYPVERLNYLIQDAGITVLLTEQGLLNNSLDSTIGNRLNVICLDRDWGLVSRESEANLLHLATAETLAYLMYTSGSTGQPKGVGIPQRAVSRLVLETNYARFGKEEVFLQMAPTSFDASTFELWGALLHGSRCVLYPGGLPNLKALGEVIEHYQVTTLWLTASLFNTVIDDAPEILRPIRQLLIGGEALSVTHVRQAKQQLPNTQIINGYGPTENTTFTCCHTIAEVVDSSRPIPIGKSITNTQVYLLDRYLNPVPVGVVGELYTGGEGLARGYWGRADLTAERFIPNPFGQTEGERLYRTGDLARYIADGNIEFLGRLDNQIKIRGFRIELGEIEAALCRHSLVEQAVVTCREDTGEKRLVAYFTVNTAERSIDELRNFLKSQVPEYMVPAVFIRLDRLPLTTSGKVDRRALPKPLGLEAEGNGYCPPRDRLEHQLVVLWESVLQVENPGVTDNFFDLGGHSLLAVKLLARINQSLDRDLPLVSVFQAPTVQQMAQLLRQQGWKPLGESLVVVQPNGSKPPFFCVHGWAGSFRLAAHLGPDQPVYGLVQGLDGNRFFTRVEELAAHYLKDIKAICPQGPYFIGGHSFGGLVALEIAHELRKAGEEVGLLALFDPTTGRQADQQPSSELGDSKPKRNQSSSERLGSRMLRHARHLKQLPTETRTEYIWERFGMMLALLGNKGKRLICRICLQLGWSLPPTLRIFFFREILFAGAYRDASRAYRPRPYEGRALLILGERRGGFDPEEIWRALIPNGTIYAVHGDHSGILQEPHVGVLASHLRNCLEEAQNSRDSMRIPKDPSDRWSSMVMTRAVHGSP